MGIGNVWHSTSQRAKGGSALTWGVIAILVVALIVVAAARAAPEDPPFDLRSARPNGLRGLILWLEALGYTVEETGGLRFEMPEKADLIFLYPNRLSFHETEAAELRGWVEAGHTLVMVGPHPEDGELERAFGVLTHPSDGFVTLERQSQPLLPEGRESYSSDWFASSRALDLTDAPGAVVVLEATGGAPVAAVQRIGAGVVWHLTTGNGLTNGGLRNGRQGDLLPAILRTVPDRGLVVFDTYHLFGLSRIGEQITTLQDWLYRTPTGWATLFSAVVLMLFLVLQGRRLGPPLPTVYERRRREMAEYVRAMAGLAQRAHLSAAVADHHRWRLKRGLARRRGLDAELADELFVAQLAETTPPVDAVTLDAVHTTLTGLAGRPNEDTLVELVGSVDRLLNYHSGNGPSRRP